MFDFRDKLRPKIDPRPSQSGIEKAMQHKKNIFLCLARFEVWPGFGSAIVAMVEFTLGEGKISDGIETIFRFAATTF